MILVLNFFYSSNFSLVIPCNSMTIRGRITQPLLMMAIPITHKQLTKDRAYDCVCNSGFPLRDAVGTLLEEKLSIMKILVLLLNIENEQ